MTKLNFTRSRFDSCVYLKKSSASPIYLLLHVDDILNETEIQNIKVLLSKEYEIKDRGAA